VPAISRGEARGGELGHPALFLLSILKLAVVALDTAVVAPIVVALALVSQRTSYRVCQLWARLNLLVCGVRVQRRRLGRLDPNAAYVFMSNHRSQYDILAVVAALDEFQLRWVAKKELTRVPVFGWALKHTGHIIIDRSDHVQAVRSLSAAREQMLDGISVVIFPEGTRSPAGQVLLPLKKGGFMLALEAGFPIVPVVVRGSREILPRGSWRPEPGEVEVIVGEPIPVAGVERDELMRRVRTFMLEQLGAPGRVHSGVAAEAV
jgi:1-acyl-sn-glycerol-3-phosphate acyltransferase